MIPQSTPNYAPIQSKLLQLYLLTLFLYRPNRSVAARVFRVLRSSKQSRLPGFQNLNSSVEHFLRTILKKHVFKSRILWLRSPRSSFSYQLLACEWIIFQRPSNNLNASVPWDRYCDIQLQKRNFLSFLCDSRGYANDAEDVMSDTQRDLYNLSVLCRDMYQSQEGKNDWPTLLTPLFCFSNRKWVLLTYVAP
jgi:hypothetical protein